MLDWIKLFVSLNSLLLELALTITHISLLFVLSQPKKKKKISIPWKRKAQKDGNAQSNFFQSNKIAIFLNFFWQTNCLICVYCWQTTNKHVWTKNETNFFLNLHKKVIKIFLIFNNGYLNSGQGSTLSCPLFKFRPKLV